MLLLHRTRFGFSASCQSGHSLRQRRLAPGVKSKNLIHASCSPFQHYSWLLKLDTYCNFNAAHTELFWFLLGPVLGLSTNIVSPALVIRLSLNIKHHYNVPHDAHQTRLRIYPSVPFAPSIFWFVGTCKPCLTREGSGARCRGISAAA